MVKDDGQTRDEENAAVQINDYGILAWEYLGVFELGRREQNRCRSKETGEGYGTCGVHCD